METLAHESGSRGLVLRYAAFFCAVHLLASTLLGFILSYVFIRFGVLGLPGAHVALLVGVALTTTYLFVRRENRLLQPTELWGLVAVCGAYIVLLDLVLAHAYVSGVGINLNGLVLGGLVGILDVLWFYLTLRFLGRWLMMRHLSRDRAPNKRWRGP